MKNTTSLILLALAISILVPCAGLASDHADPIKLTQLEAGITGLFAFPVGDDLVVALALRRGLTSGPPYDLEDYEYTIYMDIGANISFTDEEKLARFGGTVNEPAEIREDIAIRFRLNGDKGVVAQTGFPKFEGLQNTSDIEVYTGVRDDPFIFPRFFEKNVIAIVLKIPFSSFPAGTQDWLLWGTTTRHGLFGTRQIDHVGRSNRSQLGRFDFLNTLHPSQHVEAIQTRRDRGVSLQSGLSHLMGHFLPVGAVSGLFQYVLQVRHYDVAPDVMIFTTRLPPGFPNGRRLPDDVAGITCSNGDCVLQENAFIEGKWPRQVINDKEFSPDFPYLADPWPVAKEERHVDRCALVFWLIALILLVAWIIAKKRNAAGSEVPVVRRYHPRLTDR